MGRKKLPKEVQAMVDGGLNLLNIIIALVAAVRALAAKLKKTDVEWTAALHRLSQPEGKETLAQMAAVVLGTTTQAAAVVCKTFAELLAACQQGFVNPGFTEERWHLEPVEPDEDEWEVAEYFFTDDADGIEKLRRLAELEKRGEIRMFRGVRRAMEFVASHLNLQLNHPLVVPVSAQDSDGVLCLPVFDFDWVDDVRERGLHLFLVRLGFSSFCGWLVLRKRKA